MAELEFQSKFINSNDLDLSSSNDLGVRCEGLMLSSGSAYGIYWKDIERTTIGTETMHGRPLLSSMLFWWHKVLHQYELSPIQTCLLEGPLAQWDLLGMP